VDPLEIIRQIGSVEALEQAARRGQTPTCIPALNTHIHLPPNFSAFETVQEAVERAAGENVRVLGAGNYYDFSIYDDFAKACCKHGIFPLFNTEIITLDEPLRRQGIRINDPGNPGKMYLCGKGICRLADPGSEGRRLLEKIRLNDAQRMRQMIEKMSRYFCERGVPVHLDDQAIIARVVKRHRCRPETVTLQERHAAQAFQEVFFEKVPPGQRTEKLTALFGMPPKAGPEDAVGIQNEIRSHLMKAGKPCFVPETFLSPAEAEELIEHLGGIVCYPVLADGAHPICEFEASPEHLVETLRQRRYPMVEFISVRNDAQILAQYAKAVRAAGIVVTVGTEHNTLEMLPLQPRCLNGVPLSEELKNLFWEGACVLAAHQFLSAHGREGFGSRGGDFTDRERAARIERFARLGAAVLAQYFQRYSQGS